MQPPVCAHQGRCLIRLRTPSDLSPVFPHPTSTSSSLPHTFRKKACFVHSSSLHVTCLSVFYPCFGPKISRKKKEKYSGHTVSLNKKSMNSCNDSICFVFNPCFLGSCLKIHGSLAHFYLQKLACGGPLSKSVHPLEFYSLAFLWPELKHTHTKIYLY